MSRRYAVTTSGEVKPKASPALLPERLRKLPGELVARDIDDPDRAHLLDPSHVVESLVFESEKKQHEAENPSPEKPEDAVKKLWAPGPGERAPVRQWFVDVVRFRVLGTLIREAVAAHAAGGSSAPYFAYKHLRFPTNNVNEYELHDGLPPRRKELRRHERDIDLVIDVMNPPKSIVAELKQRGIDFDPRRLLEEATREQPLVTLS